MLLICWQYIAFAHFYHVNNLFTKCTRGFILGLRSSQGSQTARRPITNPARGSPTAADAPTTQLEQNSTLKDEAELKRGLSFAHCGYAWLDCVKKAMSYQPNDRVFVAWGEVCLTWWSLMLKLRRCQSAEWAAQLCQHLSEDNSPLHLLLNRTLSTL